MDFGVCLNIFKYGAAFFSVMEYEEAYVRNIGIFTAEQQEILRNSKVTIGGLGGVGGYAALGIARYGIGELSIMDPGLFGLPDMNRQYGALEHTIGRNKAKVMEEILKEVNPFMKINTSTQAILDSSELERFMEGSALVIDAIDAFACEQRELYAQVARKLGLYNINCGVGWGENESSVYMIIFDPEGVHLEEIFNHLKAPPLNCPQQVGTNMAAGAWAALEAAAIITGKKKKKDILCAPFEREWNLYTGESYLYRFNQL